MKKESKNRYSKIYYKIMCLLFILVLATITGLNIIKKDKNFSDTENRMLAQKPKFTIEKFMEGRFTKKFEKYKVDQFINRDMWIKIKSSTDKLLGKNKSSGVYLGKDGYLIEDFEKPSDKVLSKNIKAINKFSNKYKNINQYMAIVPNAVDILNEKLPKYAPVISQKKYIDGFESNLNKNINTIDAYKALKSHNDEYIYYKTDHHWTTLGAYYTFLEAAKTMKLDSSKNEYEKFRVSNNFYGTLYSKSGYEVKTPDNIDIYIPKNKEDEYIINYIDEQKKTASFYDSSKLDTKDKYGVFLGGNHPIVNIKTTSQSNKKILIFKDSYANSFVEFLTPYFSEIIMVDPRYYYDDIDKLISDKKITDMLFLYNANTFFSDTSLELVLNNL